MHQSVLLEESIENLSLKPGGVYVDGTFGRGGHSRAILDQLDDSGELIAFDKDIDAHQFAIKDPRFTLVHASFAKLAKVLNGRKIDGILLDLGVSSPQLDVAQRGFSFKQDGPLDMRMDQTQGESVAELLTHISETDLAHMLKVYGEERFAKRIAHTILAEQTKNPITRTLALQKIVAGCVSSKEKKDPATRTFQALRIYINKELADLEALLAEVYDCLNDGGRLVVISFHSLEDRIVKHFMQKMSKGEVYPRGLPVKSTHFGAKFRLVAQKVRASKLEVESNIRARSAILRCVEKINE